MTNLIKNIFVTVAVLSLSACASTGGKSTISKKIQHAPAIDVAYRQAAENLQDHIGVNVRWGGQIVAAEDVGNKTRLTVIAYPLSNEGKPIAKSSNKFQGGHFIVELENFDIDESGDLMTVYGKISSEEVLTNGKLKKSIPVVTAFETESWDLDSRRRYADRHYRPYHGFGLTAGFGHGWFFPRLGISYYDYYNRFGLSYVYTSNRYGSRRFYRGRR